MKRLLLSLTLASAALLGIALPAHGAVTIGSNLVTTHTTNMPGCNIPCTATNLALAPANTALGGLRSPVRGTVTSWRVRANTGNALRLRVLRPVAATTFTGVGISEAGSFAGPGVSPEFPTSLPINIGDWIGLESSSGNLVLGTNPGATMAFWNMPVLAEGATLAANGTGAGVEVLVQATVQPSNQLIFGRRTFNRKKGTTTLTVVVPNPGAISFPRVKGVNVSGPTAIAAGGEFKYKVRARGKKRKRLLDKGKATVQPRFSFAPRDGVAGSQQVSVKLRKRR